MKLIPKSAIFFFLAVLTTAKRMVAITTSEGELDAAFAETQQGLYVGCAYLCLKWISS